LGGGQIFTLDISEINANAGSITKRSNAWEKGMIMNPNKMMIGNHPYLLLFTLLDFWIMIFTSSVQFE